MWTCHQWEPPERSLAHRTVPITLTAVGWHLFVWVAAPTERAISEGRASGLCLLGSPPVALFICSAAAASSFASVRASISKFSWNRDQWLLESSGVPVPDRDAQAAALWTSCCPVRGHYWGTTLTVEDPSPGPSRELSALQVWLGSQFFKDNIYACVCIYTYTQVYFLDSVPLQSKTNTGVSFQSFCWQRNSCCFLWLNQKC